MIKPLGVAVATAAAAYSAASFAQTMPSVANNALGDLAIVPYYTVEGSWVTGVHVVNTSDKTQVVKFRLRRAADSLDALDFNIIMSPEDVWTGLISDDADGQISFKNFGDTTCSAPQVTGGTFLMPEIYANGAETGYVEVIGMGQPTTESLPIAVGALHAKSGSTEGVPADCAAVATNFLRGGTSASNPGNVDFQTAWQGTSSVRAIAAGGANTFVDTPNVLKVSYFIRDTETGVEFGDNAVHIADFLQEPAMTNQVSGILSGDLNGFDFPDLNGGAITGSQRDRFEMLRQNTVLGVSSILNEWSSNPENGAVVNWVVTMPGQYTMLNFPGYIQALEGDRSCSRGSASTTFPLVVDASDTSGSVSNCDFRDLPVRVSTSVYNREEKPAIQQTDLVVSPALPGARTELTKEVNLISTGGNVVLGEEADNDISFTGEIFGWVDLSVDPRPNTVQAICEWNAGDSGKDVFDLSQTCDAAGGNVPITGFAAWVRSVNDNPDASYGRIIAHSFNS
jgi:hypothetical protein